MSKRGDLWDIWGYTVNMRNIAYIDWRWDEQTEMAHIYFSGRLEPLAVDRLTLARVLDLDLHRGLARQREGQSDE